MDIISCAGARASAGALPPLLSLISPLSLLLLLMLPLLLLLLLLLPVLCRLTADRRMARMSDPNPSDIG